MQCADIVFNKTAQLLASDQCVNGTGVSAQAIGSKGESTNATNATGTGAAGSKPTTAGADMLKPVAGAGLLAGLLAWGLL
jgi:hypothetical protein